MIPFFLRMDGRYVSDGILPGRGGEALCLVGAADKHNTLIREATFLHDSQ